MKFGWINIVNAIAAAWLILVNIVAAKKGAAKDMKSRHIWLNVLEQVGRYGCIVCMVFPLFVRGREFGFSSASLMVMWLVLTAAVLFSYTYLWRVKKDHGKGVLYGLAALPAALFLANGLLLTHWLLAALAVLFGICHLAIVTENINGGKTE